MTSEAKREENVKKTEIVCQVEVGYVSNKASDSIVDT